MKSELRQAIEEELTRREAARRHLAPFVRLWYRNAKKALLWNWHLDYLCDVLEAVGRRELRRTIINMPPRFLKSQVIAIAFHAWLIGRDDSYRSSMLSCAATGALAIRDSRRTRDLLLEDWYRAVFPRVELTVKTDREWETAGGCWRNAAGAEATITGRGAHHLVCDDLLLPKDAPSEVMRRRVHDFLGDTLGSRLDDPGGTITHLQQRVHEDDPTGWLLRQAKDPQADQYLHFTLPMEAEKRTVVRLGKKTYQTREVGDLLHAERFDRTTWEATKRRVASWRLQYQQDATPAGGGMLDPRRLVPIDKSAEEVIREWGLIPRVYIDCAGTERSAQSDDPDYAAIAVLARDRLDRVHLLHLWRGQVLLDGLADELEGVARRWRPQVLKGEKTHQFDGLTAIFRERWRRGGPRLFVLDPISHGGRDKVVRAQPLRAILQARQLCVPAAADWRHEMESELRAFPNGRHDDQVDALAYGILDLETLPRGTPPPPKGPANELTGEQLERALEEQKRKLAQLRRPGVPRTG